MDTITTQDLIRTFGAIRAAIETHKLELSRLDGMVGDADHGISMALGFEAVVAALAAEAPTTPSAVFASAARAFLDAVGASTGPLYATAFMRAGAVARGKLTLAPEDIGAIVAAMARGIADRGKARPGEKTMLDAWAPAAEAAERAAADGCDTRACLTRALEAAVEGAEATKAMVATKGRAARLGERALGHMDPGAASAVIILRAMATSL